ncbi:MAG: MarR family winged helix-turn-helix transcriptional regulator [Gemmatimonadaceae bacterium]
MPTTTSDPASPTFMDPALMPWVLVSEIYWMSYKLLERRFYELGVSASQARVPAVLHSATKPMKPSVVALVLFQETQSVTGIIHRVESRGWVTRSSDPEDRRAIGLQLTAAGRTVAGEIIRISEELYGELFAAGLTASERRAVVDVLRKVRTRAFELPETDFKLRRARQFPIWRD